MAKITKTLFLILLFCSTIYGATNYMSALKIYDKKIEISSDDDLLKIHHSLVNIYIKSIVGNDAGLKKETLKRLVKTSTMLKLNSKEYQKELDTIIHKNKKIKSSKSKQVKLSRKIKTSIISHKKLQTSNYSKYLPNLKNIIYTTYSIQLIFDKKLSRKDIKTFTLKGRKSYREVFDIRSIILKKIKVKIPKKLENLRVSQYNRKILRVVLQRKSKSKSKFILNGKKLKIIFDTKKVIKKIKLQQIYENYGASLPSNKTIVIDAGHGGKDTGAIGAKQKYEKSIVLSIALKTGKILHKRGYKVYYTRTKDKFIKLRDRTRYANRKNADIFLSIHANASNKKSFHGIETFFLSPARSNRSKNVAALENKSDIKEMDYFSKQTFLNVFNREKIIAANKLALDVQQKMLNRVRSQYGSIRDGGVREAPFWVLVGAQMASILVETGYITNKTERSRLFSTRYQNLLANGIADGIDSYFFKN